MLTRRRAHEHVNHERWLVSYADFITLLFAFFVIMYAISRADLEKFKALQKSMRQAFGMAAASAPNTSGDVPAPGASVPTPAPTMSVPATRSDAALKKLSADLEESVRYEMGRTDFSEKVQFLNEDRGVVVRLAVQDFYEQGEANVRKEFLPVIDRIAKVVKDAGRRVRIEGHTDNSKVKSEFYPSNWELSTARATWMVRYLIQKWGFDPQLLEAAGYAEFHPVDTNDTDAGRARNRRVEIVVLSKDAP